MDETPLRDVYEFHFSRDYIIRLETERSVDQAIEAMRLLITHILIAMKTIGDSIAESDVNAALKRFMEGKE